MDCSHKNRLDCVVFNEEEGFVCHEMCLACIEDMRGIANTHIYIDAGDVLTIINKYRQMRSIVKDRIISARKNIEHVNRIVENQGDILKRMTARINDNK